MTTGWRSLKTLWPTHEHYQEKFYIRDLARQAGMNERISVVFKKPSEGPCHILTSIVSAGHHPAAGYGPEPAGHGHLPGLRLQQSGELLREFRKKTGATPLQYRKTFRDEKS